jgi:hypothetical protein
MLSEKRVSEMSNRASRLVLSSFVPRQIHDVPRIGCESHEYHEEQTPEQHYEEIPRPNGSLLPVSQLTRL